MNKDTFSSPTRNIQTTTGNLRDDFSGDILKPIWDTPVITGAASYSISGSNLVLNLTTGATDSIILTSIVPFSIPCRMTAALLLSARSANQEVILELVSKAYVDTNGNTGSYARWKFNGTTATAVKTQTRNEDTAGVEAARTISATSVSRAYTIDLGYDDVRFSQFDLDSIAARVSPVVHTAKIPSSDEDYFMRVTVQNTAASTALVATLDFVTIQDTNEVMVELVGGSGFTPASHSLSVAVNSMPSTSGVGGQTAHDAASTGSPIRTGSVARTALTAVSATGDAVDAPATMFGYPVVKINSIPENEFQYSGAAAIVNTTDVVLTAAGTAGIRNYLTGIQVKNTNAVATEIVIKDGSTVIWRGHVSASMVNGDNIIFNTPLKGTAATALNFACITTAANVYVNAQGYKAP